MSESCFPRKLANYMHAFQDESIIRMFDRKGYYTVHGADAAVAAKLYGGSGVVKQLGRAPNQLASVALNRSLLEQLLRSVLVENANRSVELYEGHGATWQVARYRPLHDRP
jgi:DNA mismatch repair protein MSH2